MHWCTRQSAPLLLQWLCPPMQSAAWEGAQGAPGTPSLEWFILGFNASDDWILLTQVPGSHWRQAPAVWLHLQHLLLIAVVFSDITSRAKYMIHTGAPSPPWLQGDDHIFRFYTGFHFDFSLKVCWKKGVLQAHSSQACPSLLVYRCLSPHV